jgi:hypothetical protein
MTWDWGALSPLALYGAALSTAIVVRDYVRARARAKVRAGYAVPDVVAEQSGFALVGVMANHGRESIFLRSASVEVKGSMRVSRQQPASMTQFPFELKAGQSFTAAFAAEFVQSIATYGKPGLVRVIFFDQLGREYRSAYLVPGEVRPLETGGHQLTFPPRALPRYRRWLPRRSRSEKSLQRAI